MRSPKIRGDTLEFGADKADVVAQLVDMGLDESAAARARRTPRASQDASIPMVVSGAFGAAIIGAPVWGFITDVTGYELGLVA